MLFTPPSRHFRLFTFAALLSILILTVSSALSEDLWGWDTGEKEITYIDGVPSYWLQEVQNGAREINIAMSEAGTNKSAFLFYSDVYWNFNSQQSPALLKYLHDHTGINRTIFGGNIVWDEGSDYKTMAYLWDWRAKIRQLPNHHSVVGNHDDGNTTNYLFNEDYVYSYLLAPEETSDVVRSEKGLYYYLDVTVEKTRYLFLDTAFQTILYSPDQLQFLIDTLSSVPESWHVIVIANRWYDAGERNSPNANKLTLSHEGELVLELLDAYNSRSSGIARCHTSLTDFTAHRTPYNFSDAVGKVEFCIGGHIHRDFDGASNGGIPVIHVETDSYNVRSGLERKDGTINESSVNGIIADYSANKVTVVRVGRGESRVVPLP